MDNNSMKEKMDNNPLILSDDIVYHRSSMYSPSNMYFALPAPHGSGALITHTRISICILFNNEPIDEQYNSYFRYATSKIKKLYQFNIPSNETVNLNSIKLSCIADEEMDVICCEHYYNINTGKRIEEKDEWIIDLGLEEKEEKKMEKKENENKRITKYFKWKVDATGSFVWITDEAEFIKDPEPDPQTHLFAASIPSSVNKTQSNPNLYITKSDLLDSAYDNLKQHGTFKITEAQKAELFDSENDFIDWLRKYDYIIKEYREIANYYIIEKR